MRFDIITIFPEMFAPILNESMVKRAQMKKKVAINVYDLRKYTKDKHNKVDDRPFGGGPGMVMMAQPVFDAVKKIKGRRKAKVIMLCPAGIPLTQRKARSLSKLKNLILVCAEAHQLITGGFLEVEGRDATKAVFIHWNEKAMKGKPKPFRIVGKRTAA